MNTLKFLGKKILPGTSVEIDLQVARLPSNTMIAIPVFVNHSATPGPTVLFMAGMHGDEVNGVEILRRLNRDEVKIPSKGTVILIPLINVYGFINLDRTLPDGKDVNRSFPGNKNGSLASRIAYLLWNEIFPIVDYAVDFHTGGANRRNYPQVRCSIENLSQLELAQAFNAPFIINSKMRDKSLRKMATNSGKSLIVYEGGESSRLSAHAIQVGIDGAKKVLQHFDMLPNKNALEQIETITVNDSHWIRASRSGLFKIDVKNGDFVQKNDILGYITDPYGKLEKKIKTAYTGYIICVNFAPIVNQGDALFHIAK